MADENKVESEDPIETGDPLEEGADQDISTELPDDPEALRATAIEARKEAAALRQSNRQATERAEEFEATAIYNKGKVKDLEEQLAARTAESQRPRAPKPVEKPKPLLDRKKFDEILASDEGPEELEAIIERVAERKARELQSSAQEMTEGQNAAVQKVSVKYPDILVPGSQLQVAANKVFVRLERERGDLPRDVLVELAAQEAALEIGYRPKSASDVSPSSSERLHNAQSAPHGRKLDAKPDAVKVDQSIEKFAKKHGVPLDASSRKIIADLQAQESKRSARK